MASISRTTHLVTVTNKLNLFHLEEPDQSYFIAKRLILQKKKKKCARPPLGVISSAQLSAFTLIHRFPPCVKRSLPCDPCVVPPSQRGRRGIRVAPPLRGFTILQVAINSSWWTSKNRGKKRLRQSDFDSSQKAEFVASLNLMGVDPEFFFS